VSSTKNEIERLLRELAPQALGVVTRRFHDFTAAEDATQEAMITAAARWQNEGIPDNPRAWLIQVACRRMADHIRSESARKAREAEAFPALFIADSSSLEMETAEDDTLVLMFMCCHPSLTTSSAIALTLRAVGGLTTSQIARAFLVPEATMAQRISRAKQSIKTSGVPFSMPPAEEYATQLRAVQHVLYLIFSEAYTSSEGAQLQDVELSKEAIRLTRIAHGILPEEPELSGLLALMLLTDARRAARSGPEGELIPLTAQDRTLWDRDEIAEGEAILTSSLTRGAVGAYQLQAAIAALHSEAASAEDTDWPQILALYDLLKRMSDNPMVRLSHAVAFAMVHGPKKGLELIDELDAEGSLKGNHRLAAVRAHLCEMAGDQAAAITNYRLAASMTASIPERNYLTSQAARINAASSTPPNSHGELGVSFYF
jgi:RNA polymerase sigma factor (sigma-70 family)